jgi:hypothetical protein
MKRVVWSVSYPRSGSMFLRFLVSTAMNSDKEMGWGDVERYFMDMHSTPTEEILKQEAPLIFIKSHHLLLPDYKKVIYLYRDIRDVVISYYHYCCFRDKESYVVDDFLAKSLAGDKLLLFGIWYNHVKVWTDKFINTKILFVRYEDLVGNTREELKKVLDFSEAAYLDSTLTQAVERTKFQTMKKKALSESVNPAFSGLSGRAGGWRDLLTNEQQGLIWDTVGDLLLNLGYSKE